MRIYNSVGPYRTEISKYVFTGKTKVFLTAEYGTICNALDVAKALANDLKSYCYKVYSVNGFILGYGVPK